MVLQELSSISLQVYTPFVDDSHEELPLDMSRRPEVPFWSGQETEFANQVIFYYAP